MIINNFTQTLLSILIKSWTNNKIIANPKTNHHSYPQPASNQMLTLKKKLKTC